VCVPLGAARSSRTIAYGIVPSVAEEFLQHHYEAIAGDNGSNRKSRGVSAPASKPGCSVYVRWFHPCWRTSQTPRGAPDTPGSIKAARPHPQRTLLALCTPRQQLCGTQTLKQPTKLHLKDNA